MTTAGTLVPVREFGPFDELSDQAHQHYIDGFAERAVAACRTYQPLARAAGDMSTLRFLLYTESISLMELGRHGDAVDAARTILSLSGPDDHVWRAKALAMVAEASTREGQQSRALGALAEADWAVSAVPSGSYGHISASMAVALALRSVTLFEHADERLCELLHVEDDWIRLLVVHELTELAATWAVSLALLGRTEDARVEFLTTLERSLHMQRLGWRTDSPAMVARGEIYEAFALLNLGEPELALGRALAAKDRFQHRRELLETQLYRLVTAHAATTDGDFARARELLRAAVADATANGREAWVGMGLEALAEVDVAEHGHTPATAIWRDMARSALARLWSEREGRFTALQDRDHIRRLTAETDRMGRVVLQDPLTGLGNRRLLVATLEASPRPMSVVFIDVDNFKSVNDQYSHAVGDEVLRRIAQVLRAQCRAEDVIVRYGGDEFIVLTAHDDRRARSVAERVHRAIRNHPWDELERGLTVTVSIGVGVPDASTENPLVAADIALITAKRAGRDQVAGLESDDDPADDAASVALRRD
ncbi:diguanylate cyclase [Actinotalea sp. Marseille-Q4924]|uniref:GGDEF domain-containing protein n=1 Tax=Actinotalea sp. Marseille-Q4924 TaxID=2866571 RepID=UPI001CE43098|nr:GGDEF domain-containing protein [Actinotalea sp. Marseille-Q4924]